jgi:hypothetical protein
MRKLLVIALVFLGGAAMAQESLVKVSPFYFFDGTFYASYEKSLENSRSIQLDGGVRLTDNGNDYGWMGEVQLRKYLFSSKCAGSGPLSGFYAGVYANGKYFKEYNEWTDWQWIEEPYYDYVYHDNGDINWEETVFHEGESEEQLMNESYDVNQGEGGVLFGFQAILNETLSFDVFIGGGVRAAQIDGEKTGYFYDSGRGYTGVVPKAGFSVGIAF